MKNEDEKLSRLYQVRFPEEELVLKNKLWKALIKSVLQKYIKEDDIVLDLGGGQCLFINNVKCRKKYAVDLNPDVKKYADDDVIILQNRADNISAISDGSINVVFVSNFFEHMKDKDELEDVVAEIKRMLSRDGLLLVIQPNIRFAYKEYWDVIDHYIPISDRSLSDLLEINNFMIKECYPRFLPWSPRARLSRFVFLLRLYLRFPLFWRIFGKQAFLVAQIMPEGEKAKGNG